MSFFRWLASVIIFWIDLFRRKNRKAVSGKFVFREKERPDPEDTKT